MKKIFLFFMTFFIGILLVKAEENTLAKNAKSAILIESSTGQILYEYNSHEKLEPASMTKMMGLILVCEAITQENIAEATGKTRQTVSQYVNGKSEPGYDTLVKIADYFDVSVDYLIGRTGIKEKPVTIPGDELGNTAREIMDMISDFSNEELALVKARIAKIKESR
jgi:transcriptional regulator with XRE-family HTH domain